MEEVKTVNILIPDLTAGVAKGKNAESEDAKNYISVTNGHAIVTGIHGVVVVCLKEYFENISKSKIDHFEKDEYEKLLDWMEGKNFSAEFWDKIKGLNRIGVINDTTLLVERESLKENLIYSHREAQIYDVNMHLMNTMTAIKSNPELFSIEISALAYIDKVVSKLTKNSSYIFEYTGSDRPYRFTMLDMPGIFGLISCDSSKAEKPFNFDSFLNYVETLNL